MPKVCPVCGASYADANIFCPTDGSTLRAAEAQGDLIGTVIADRYLVTDLLGEGGMGKVYLARHVRLPQQAAIKVLRPAMLRDPAAVARFNREAANASRIEHERIARVFDYGESADGTVYLAMEYVPGRTLKQLLQAEGAQSPERSVAITRQVAEALDAAHRLGIVHRDLKPDNVMITEDAELGDRCKVVDFGIAKAVGGEAGDPGLTKTGFVVGTPEYMSPEQLVGGDVDHRSDVYALALLSFKCLTGELPFDSSTPERAMTARLIDTPRSLADAAPAEEWSDEVQAVFSRGLAREPVNRFPSAGAFARELQSAFSLGSEQPSGSFTAAATRATQQPETIEVPDTPTVRLRTPAETPTHHPSRVPAIVGGLIGVVAVAAVAFVMLRPAADAPLGSTDSTAVAIPAPVAAAGGDPVDGPPPPIRPVDSAVEAQAVPVASGKQNRVSSAINEPASTSQRAATLPSSENSAARAADARRTLDSLRVVLDPASATEAEARRGVSALRALLPRLTTAEDSAWAYIRQAEAHFLMVDERSACVALQAARPLVRSGSQREVLSVLSSVLTVSC